MSSSSSIVMRVDTYHIVKERTYPPRILNHVNRGVIDFFMSSILQVQDLCNVTWLVGKLVSNLSTSRQLFIPERNLISEWRQRYSLVS